MNQKLYMGFSVYMYYMDVDFCIPSTDQTDIHSGCYNDHFEILSAEMNEYHGIHLVFDYGDALFKMEISSLLRSNIETEKKNSVTLSLAISRIVSMSV